MATFKVGQRVRIVSVEYPFLSSDADLVGREGVIIGYDPEYRSSFDGRLLPWSVAVDNYGEAGFLDHNLAPLTDPKADAFIESVKKWKPEPVVPLPMKERA